MGEIAGAFAHEFAVDRIGLEMHEGRGRGLVSDLDIEPRREPVIDDGKRLRHVHVGAVAIEADVRAGLEEVLATFPLTKEVAAAARGFIEETIS